MSEPVPCIRYVETATGRKFWRPQVGLNTEPVQIGWTVRHPDGTTGLGHSPWETKAEAEAWCLANPHFRGLD